MRKVLVGNVLKLVSDVFLLPKNYDFIIIQSMTNDALKISTRKKSRRKIRYFKFEVRG